MKNYKRAHVFASLTKLYIMRNVIEIFSLSDAVNLHKALILSCTENFLSLDSLSNVTRPDSYFPIVLWLLDKNLFATCCAASQKSEFFPRRLVLANSSVRQRRKRASKWSKNINFFSFIPFFISYRKREKEKNVQFNIYREAIKRIVPTCYEYQKKRFN